MLTAEQLPESRFQNHNEHLGLEFYVICFQFHLVIFCFYIMFYRNPFFFFILVLQAQSWIFSPPSFASGARECSYYANSTEKGLYLSLKKMSIYLSESELGTQPHSLG